MADLTCILCESGHLRILETEYWVCEDCGLIFKNPDSRLSHDEERERYSLHQNTIDNEGYIRFLSGVVEIVKSRVPKGALGLDYGCGPGPVLAELLRRERYSMEIFDPFFAPKDLSAMSHAFDFVTCTEAAEHFYSPGREFEAIFALLKPNGFLVLQTELVPKEISIKDWYYARDPTHVALFTDKTILYLKNQYGDNRIIHHSAGSSRKISPK